MAYRPDEILVKPIVPMSLVLWLKELFSPNTDYHPQNFPHNTDILTIFKKIINRSLLETYSFDGYDVTTNKVITVNGNELEYTSTSFPGLSVLSFFALPSRPSLRTDANGNRHFITSIHSMDRQFIGWRQSHANDPSKEKSLWNYASLLFNVLFSPISIFIMTIKINANIAKLMTEFIPSLIMYSSGPAVEFSQQQLKTIWNAQNWGSNIVGIVLLEFWGIATASLGIIHYASRMILLVGRAFTSPEKSARIALSVGRALIVGEGRRSSIIRTLVGLTFAILSIALTAAGSVLFVILFQTSLVDTLRITATRIPWLIPTFKLPYILITNSAHSLGYALEFFGVMMAVTSIVVIANRISNEFSNFWYRLKSRGPIIWARDTARDAIQGYNARTERRLLNQQVIITAAICSKYEVPKDVAKQIMLYVKPTTDRTYLNEVVKRTYPVGKNIQFFEAVVSAEESEEDYRQASQDLSETDSLLVLEKSR